MSHVCEFDSKVGIVKILEFNIVTPSQFCSAVDGLLAKGCDKFVFDVRNNPGGDLKSIQAVLSYFINDKDVYIRVSNKKGSEVSYKVSAITYTDSYAGCSVTKEELGKYRNLNFAVLTNQNTASAAELFTGTLKDYGLSLTVGGTTYGKGTMQSTYKLSQYGYSGAIKLTTKYYYPPISESYEGVGIEPDVKVELDPSLEGKNIYTITDAEDNQLGRAIEELYKKNDKN
jgi:carboxyl-terminal processing protease